MAPAWASAADIGERHTGTLAGAMNMMASFMAAVESKSVGRLLAANDVVLPFIVFALVYGAGALAWIGVNARRTLADDDHGDADSTT